LLAAVAPCEVPSDRSTLVSPGLVTVLNPVPEVPEVPLEPDVPEVPEVPLEPDVPEVPEVPLEPEVPETPDDPEVPEVPDFPATDISTRIVLTEEVGVHPVPETYDTGNSQYVPLSTGGLVTV
jgi:hypothetical protein